MGLQEDVVHTWKILTQGSHCILPYETWIPAAVPWKGQQAPYLETFGPLMIPNTK